MTSFRRPSLLDDPQFLEALDKIETGAASSRSAAVPQQTLDGLDAGLPVCVLQFPQVLAIDDDWDEDEEPLDAFASEGPLTEAHRRSQIGLVATAFFMLMTACGAGTALLFHHQVAAIVAVLR